MENTVITKEQFFADVIHEITMLKKHAFKKELANLNFDTFNPLRPGKCIYGQMTGSCDSNRAKSLMNKACIRVFHEIGGVQDLEGKPFSNVSTTINGKYKGQMWKNRGWIFQRTFNYLSALEGYICLKNAKTNHIIEFLKDETNTIKLKL